jgi:hypothetical protein
VTVEAERPRARTGRTGSFVSSKEIARASVDGRKVTFTVVGLEPVSGFVVAMDDYHWKVAVPIIQQSDDPDEDLFKTVLVHKSAPLVEVDRKPYDLRDGTPQALVLIAMSEQFWRYCNKTYFGRADTGRDVSTESETQA